ncbi:hypothetical protein AVEN_35108-1 [Araneus ventricosus]|uniref:Uncharacterized protein n=1 Tax=Araneus ventricosus TaxID=182803 RepID=A0A4Y2I6V7_ARAVE|nr:hypothetical protein AVEN_35108-1 [Araneus ventricosus]
MHKDAYAGALSKFSSTTARTPASESPENTPEKPRCPFLSYFSILLSSGTRPLSQAEAPPTSPLTSVAAQEQRSPPGLFVKRKNCVCSPATILPQKLRIPAESQRARPSLLPSQNLSVPDRRQTKNFGHRPQTGEKHHYFQFKGQLEGGKAEFLQCARTESQGGLVFPGNSSPARVNNF